MKPVSETIPIYANFLYDRLASSQRNESPFPHWIIDDLLPLEIAENLEKDFRKVKASEWEGYSYEMQTKFANTDIFSFPPSLKDFVLLLSTGNFLERLGNLTNIKKLISDPYLDGGGLHEIKSNGRLEVHADFSTHRIMNLSRRLNLIYYLNPKWSADYGGDLVFFDKDGETPIKRIPPTFNRAVIFETLTDSFHGHPNPLTCPEHITRKSIALYYYTAERVPNVRGVNTRWRKASQIKPIAQTPRDIVSRLLWNLNLRLRKIADYIERLHDRVDTN
jgi:hypothetical protein